MDRAQNNLDWGQTRWGLTKEAIWNWYCFCNDPLHLSQGATYRPLSFQPMHSHKSNYAVFQFLNGKVFLPAGHQLHRYPHICLWKTTPYTTASSHATARAVVLTLGGWDCLLQEWGSPWCFWVLPKPVKDSTDFWESCVHACAVYVLDRVCACVLSHQHRAGSALLVLTDVQICICRQTYTDHSWNRNKPGVLDGCAQTCICRRTYIGHVRNGDKWCDQPFSSYV